jgi:hypothetical protein
VKLLSPYNLAEEATSDDVVDRCVDPSENTLTFNRI